MEIHKPNPFHTLREFLGEVGVIVLGVIIALAAEQAVQSVDRSHKMRLADEQMQQEIAVDDGPQVYERIALSPCVNATLEAINYAVEQGHARSAVAEMVKQYWAPSHTWDDVVFRSDGASGVLAQMPAAHFDLIARFYSLMPALEGANEREFRDAAALFASKTGGVALSEMERERLLGAVEALRRDNVEMVRLATLARESISRIGIKVGSHHTLPGGASPLQDAERIVTEMEAHPMAQPCVPALKAAMPRS